MFINLYHSPSVNTGQLEARKGSVEKQRVLVHYGVIEYLKKKKKTLCLWQPNPVVQQSDRA